MRKKHAPIRDTKLIADAMRYIERNLREPIRLTRMAQQLYVSPSRLSHTFKAKTGVSPIRYIMEQRVKEARTLLLYSDCTITEIAVQLGFHDPSYFSRTFKKITGVTPSEYRGGFRKRDAAARTES